jgi:CRP-like cAMP-binding protein
VLAGETFTNLSQPQGQHAIRVTSVFAIEDRPDQVCAMLSRVASLLPECHPDLSPVAVPLGQMKYRTKIPLRSPGDDGAAEAMFLRWIWYAARREGLHLDEAEDRFSDDGMVESAIRTVVAPALHLTAEQQHAMLPHAVIERFGAGELIQAAGTVPDRMSLVISGTVLLTADDEDGSRTEVSTLERGAYIGQTTLVRHAVTWSSVALDEVTLVRVSREAIERVVQRNPVLLQEFGRSMDERQASVLRALSGDSGPTYSVEA